MKAVTKYMLAGCLIAIMTISGFAFYSIYQYQAAEVREEHKKLDTCLHTFWELLGHKGQGFRVVNDQLFVGDYLINNNFEVPDKVQKIFGGVATIFMGDERVSTNVLDGEGKRAVGTRLVGAVHTAIFKEGRSYRGEALILGIPYLTAYDPIRDSDGTIVGVLFVGLRESEFIAGISGLKNHMVLSLFAILTVFTTLMALLGREIQKIGRKNEQQRTFLQTLIDTIPTPIYYKDTACRYIGCNKAFEAHVGFSQDGLIGKTHHEIWPKELADRYLQQDMALLEDPGIQVYEDSVRDADGTPRDVIFNKGTFYESNGSVAGLVGVVLDITERKRAGEEKSRLESQLRQTQIMETLMVRLGHDLKTPLTPLMILLPLIKNRVSDPEIKKMVDMCSENIHCIKALAEKSKMFISLVSTIKPYDYQNITLVSAVEECVAGSAGMIATKSLSCQISVDPLIVVPVVPDQLKELLANLISNAVHFSREHGIIYIAAEQHAETVSVSLRDEGVGLTADHLEHVFDEFFKADESRHELGTSGLGLSICKRIVQNHHGKIWAESAGLGHGTTIVFTLNQHSNAIQRSEKETVTNG